MYVAMLGVMENRKHLLSPGSDRAKARVTASEPDTKNYKHRQVAYQNAVTRAYAYLGAVWSAILVSRGQVPDTTQNKPYGCLETQMEKLKVPGSETCSAA